MIRSWQALSALWITSVTIIIGLAILGTSLGSTYIPLGEVIHSLQTALGLDGGTGVSGAIDRIIVDIRLPRVLLAVCVGAGLATVGTLLQTTTRNDLADPFLFGLSSGAAAGAVAVISFVGDRLGVWTLPIATFVGAMLSAASVLSLVMTREEQGPERLIIAGLAVSFLFGALTSFLVFAGDQRAAYSVLFWSVGGLGLASWGNIFIAALGAVLAICAGLFLHWRLDALLAGEETAYSLGVDVTQLRRNVFILAALATASFVALSGVIGFVGLMVPHLSRALVGVNHRPLVVTGALLGAIMLLAGDLLARTLLAPQELPVGIVTAAAGGAFIIALVLRRSP